MILYPKCRCGKQPALTTPLRKPKASQNSMIETSQPQGGWWTIPFEASTSMSWVRLSSGNKVAIAWAKVDLTGKRAGSPAFARLDNHLTEIANGGYECGDWYSL